LLQILLINFDEFLDTADHHRLEEILVESKALSNSFIKWWQLCTETIKGHLIVVVKILKHSDDFSHRFDVHIHLFLASFEEGMRVLLIKWFREVYSDQ
jgi:hypothetical protein